MLKVPAWASGEKEKDFMVEVGSEADRSEALRSGNRSDELV